MARRKRKSPPLWKAWRRRILTAFGAIVALYLIWEVATWPDVAALESKRPESTAFIERYKSKNDKKRVAQIWVPYDRISIEFKHAVLAGEDIGFLFHEGFATEEIEDAIKDALFEGKKLRGASTITQQLAKNLWLSASRNPLRKLKEAALTRQLESNLSKKRILEIYMNVVELGPGVFGIEAAAQHWYGTTAAALSRDQAVALAAMLPSPKKWKPGGDNEKYKKHADAIRRRMSRSAQLRERLSAERSEQAKAPARPPKEPEETDDRVLAHPAVEAAEEVLDEAADRVLANPADETPTLETSPSTASE